MQPASFTAASIGGQAAQAVCILTDASLGGTDATGMACTLACLGVQLTAWLRLSTTASGWSCGRHGPATWCASCRAHLSCVSAQPCCWLVGWQLTVKASCECSWRTKRGTGWSRWWFPDCALKLMDRLRWTVDALCACREHELADRVLHVAWLFDQGQLSCMHASVNQDVALTA
jgi:hypothetical protein